MNRSSLIVGNGCKMRLKATPVPANTAVRWESMNTNTATVSSDGVVTAVNKGTVNIICYPVSDPHAVASCKVTVKEPVSKIVLSNTSESVWKGKSITLTGTTAPRSAYSTVRWSSSDTKVCTVDSNGKVTAVGKGTATITCAAADGSGKKATCKITVKVPVSKITLSKTKFTFVKGKSTVLKATAAPSSANNKAVTWKSSNTKVAVVTQNGKVTAKGKGTATITYTAKDGSKVKATCSVSVK